MLVISHSSACSSWIWTQSSWPLYHLSHNSTQVCDSSLELSPFMSAMKHAPIVFIRLSYFHLPSKLPPQSSMPIILLMIYIPIYQVYKVAKSKIVTYDSCPSPLTSNRSPNHRHLSCKWLLVHSCSSKGLLGVLISHLDFHEYRLHEGKKQACLCIESLVQY